MANDVTSPWESPLAPDSPAGAILVGNFSDQNGFINAFAANGTYLGMIMAGSDPLDVGTRTGGAGVDLNSVYFTAGIGDEDHGLFQADASCAELNVAMGCVSFGAMSLALRGRPKLAEL